MSLNRIDLPVWDDLLAHAQFPPHRSSARDARNLVRSVCADLVGNDTLDSIVLLTDELVANAVVHARFPTDVRVGRGGGLLVVAVSEDGPGDPVVRPHAPDRVGGRGLAIVQSLAHSWGVARDAGHKTVWFTVICP